MLKKLIIGMGLTAIVATSAMAQSYQPEVGSGNIVPKNTGGAPAYYNYRGSDAYAYAPRYHLHHDHSMHSWDRD